MGVNLSKAFTKLANKVSKAAGRPTEVRPDSGPASPGTEGFPAFVFLRSDSCG